MTQTAKKASKSKRITKKDLEERDSRIASLESEKEALQEEILARASAAGNVEARLQEAERLLQETEQLLDSVVAGNEDQEKADLVTDAVIQRLGLVAEDLFNRLQFAVLSASSVAAYEGDDPETVKTIVAGATSELLDWVAEAREDNLYQADSIVWAAFTDVASELAVGPSQG